MSLEGMFSFVSAEERNRRQLAFQNRVLPLGLRQKEAMLNAIRPLINRKITDSELLYNIFMAKQKFMDSSEDPSAEAQMYLSNCKIFSKTEKGYLLALVELDAAVNDLENYPSSEDIKEKSF